MVVEVTLGHILGEALGADVMNVPAAYPPDDAIPELTTLEDEPLATYARRLYVKGYREGYAVGHAVASGVIEELPAPQNGQPEPGVDLPPGKPRC
jgi:hypothetical protein